MIISPKVNYPFPRISIQTIIPWFHSIDCMITHLMDKQKTKNQISHLQKYKIKLKINSKECLNQPIFFLTITIYKARLI